MGQCDKRSGGLYFAAKCANVVRNSSRCAQLRNSGCAPGTIATTCARDATPRCRENVGMQRAAAVRQHTRRRCERRRTLRADQCTAAIDARHRVDLQVVIPRESRERPLCRLQLGVAHAAAACAPLAAVEHGDAARPELHRHCRIVLSLARAKPYHIEQRRRRDIAARGDRFDRALEVKRRRRIGIAARPRVPPVPQHSCRQLRDRRC